MMQQLSGKILQRLTAHAHPAVQLAGGIISSNLNPNLCFMFNSNDIALVRVNNPMYLAGETIVQPIDLPPQGYTAIQDELATVSGW